ncbi:MAG: DUF4350 domain-containing protein [Gemmatimonadales bacterium]
MRPRTELAVGAAVLVALGIGVAALGSRRARVGDSDPRRSTYLFGPSGASGFAGALARLGVRVEGWRRPVGSIDTAVAGSGGLTVFLGPSAELTPEEGAEIASLPADLLLAGPSTAAAMRCLGYDVVPWRGGSVAVRRPAQSDSLPMPMVRALLRGRSTRTFVDSSDMSDGRTISCTAPVPRTLDTLLVAAGRPVALRLGLDEGRTVLLVSDDGLFSNRAVRESAAGPLMLALVVPRYRRVVVDEYHHGFEASGSLAGTTLDWTLHSPWGWAIWQLVVVGVLALLAAGVRFGPAVPAIERRRRSPLEHVRALATALAAARGHDVAVRLIVQGLRRRLSRAGRPAREAPDQWLASLAPSVRTPRGREALERLVTITRRPAAAGEVLVAAGDVETLWEELKPS